MDSLFSILTNPVHGSYNTLDTVQTLQGWGLINVEDKCGKETDHLQEPIDLFDWGIN